MAIAGAVVVPVNGDMEQTVMDRLKGISEIEIKDSGEKGIAVVMEADEIGRLKEISEEIGGWEEVIEFTLAYLNWEDLEENQQRSGGEK